PHFVPALRPHTGRDPEVVRFLDRSTATHEFLEHTLNLLKFLIPQYVHEGKSYLTIGIGCTGGRHRSVAIAEALRKGLSGIPGVRLRVKQRDSANEGGNRVVDEARHRRRDARPARDRAGEL